MTKEGRMYPQSWRCRTVLALGVLLIATHLCLSQTPNGPPKIPCGALPPLNGYYVRQWHTAQTARADLDHFVVYRHEWYLDGPQLGPYGHHHVVEIAKRLPGVP